MKRAILIIASLSLFFAIASSISATTIIQDYPNLPACENNAQCNPASPGFGVPQFIKYIYIFALGIVGVIGFVAVIMGAFDYVTSAGNPQKASGAKDKIIAALLGLLLLVGTYVVLNTINPDLLRLKSKPPQATVSVGPPATPTGCAFVNASWDKGTINAGESVNLTLTLSNECKDKQVSIDKSNLELRQVKPKDGWDLCSKYCINEPVRNDLKISWSCTFNGRCENRVGPSPCSGPDKICNFFKTKPESFYLRGGLKINGVNQNLVEDLYITVNDLKEDNTCCR